MTAAPAPSRRAVLCGAAGCLALASCERGGDLGSTASTAPARVSPGPPSHPSSPPPSDPPGQSSGQPSPTASASLGAGSTPATAPLARSAQITAGSPLPVSLPNGRPAFLIRVPDDVVLLDGTCTHAACAVTWQPAGKVFLCPCHLSRFERAGRVLGPPATQALPRIPVVEQDGSVYLA